jgi:hypothetical protein
MNNFADLSRAEAYFSRNRTIILYSVILAIVCYGYELFNYSLSIDEEWITMLNASQVTLWIKDGRWGTYLMNFYLMPHSVMPYFPTLIAVLSIAATSILYVSSEQDDLSAKIIFSTIFITYPLHDYYLAFNISSHTIGIGVILSMAGYLLVRESLNIPGKNTWKIILAILFLTISFSTYQGVITIFVLLVAVHLIRLLTGAETYTFREILKRLAVFFGVFVFALLLYKVIDVGLKYLILPEDYRLASNHLDNYMGWKNLPAKQVLSILFQSTKRYLLGTEFYGGFAMKSIFLLLPILAYGIIRSARSASNRIMAFSLLIFTVFIPFLIMYVLGTWLPPRTIMALPFLLGVVWWLSYLHSSGWLKKVMMVCAFLIFISNMYHTTRLFYVSYTIWQADRDMANRITERIYNLDIPDKKGRINLAIIGGYQYPSNELFMKPSDIFGASFFNWDNGDPSRMIRIFQSAGVSGFQMFPYKDLGWRKDTIKFMPSWPKKGSVIVVDSVVIVKLSNKK